MKGYNVNKGFSLIELIVVIAILAVFTIMLAPKLLFYTERSRAEKDNSSMDEVVNAIQLALADQEVYDEVLRFSTVDNISCYVDTNSEANYQKVITKSNPDGVDQYTFTSNARLLDETPYFAAGNMRGVTITFAPNKDSNESTYDLKQGVINQYIQVSDNQRVGAMPELYNRLRSSVGDTIAGDSQTYRNSEYTIFIRLGTIGGNDEAAQDAVSVYGQWSGTNLPQQVSYQLVTDRTTGDDGKQIVEIDDSKWNESNGSKITVNPGDLNGGGSYDPTTETGNKQYTANDFKDSEKDIYAYLTDNNVLILRNSPKEDLSNIVTDYGKLSDTHQRKWANEAGQIEFVNIETRILPKTCHEWFMNCNNLKEVRNIKNIITDSSTSMVAMFAFCRSLKNLDLTHFNTTKVVNMERMFYYCESLKTLKINSFNTAKVYSMNNMFSNCRSLSNINLSSFDTGSCTNTWSMFYNCQELITLDLSHFTMDKVERIDNMFGNCKNLKQLNIENWNTENVVEMQGLFAGCKALSNIDISHLNTNKVKKVSSMFENCENLERVVFANFNISQVEYMNGFFRNCQKLKAVDVSGWDFSNVVDARWMFSNCYSLESIGDISIINQWDIETVNYMFQNCNNLVEKPNWYV